jgi:hypothetical protein
MNQDNNHSFKYFCFRNQLIFCYIKEMSDLQLELIKKKEKLAELKLRKQERDQGKVI